jgi:hypothetical protein
MVKYEVTIMKLETAVLFLGIILALAIAYHAHIIANAINKYKDK